MTFKEFLKDNDFAGSPAGDFVTDARQDGKMPDVKSWDELENYLSSVSASSNAIKAGKSVWVEFERRRNR